MPRRRRVANLVRKRKIHWMRCIWTCMATCPHGPPLSPCTQITQCQRLPGAMSLSLVSELPHAMCFVLREVQAAYPWLIPLFLLVWAARAWEWCRGAKPAVEEGLPVPVALTDEGEENGRPLVPPASGAAAERMPVTATEEGEENRRPLTPPPHTKDLKWPPKQRRSARLRQSIARTTGGATTRSARVLFPLDDADDHEDS